MDDVLSFNILQASSVVINLENNGLRFISSRAINFDADGLPDQTIVILSSAEDTALDVCCAYEWVSLEHVQIFIPVILSTLSIV